MNHDLNEKLHAFDEDNKVILKNWKSLETLWREPEIAERFRKFKTS